MILVYIFDVYVQFKAACLRKGEPETKEDMALNTESALFHHDPKSYGV